MSRLRFPKIEMLLLAIFSAGVFFSHLGKFELNDWDEAWHAQVAAEILTHGEWASLHYRDQPYFNKPPLSFWMKAMAFKVFGVNEFAARFFPAVFGWASVLLTAWFAGKTLGRATGVLAGLILCSSWLFTMHHAGRSAETDSTLIFFVLATAVSLWHAQFNARYLMLAALCTGLGWMSKGATAYLAWPIAGIGLFLGKFATGERTSSTAESFEKNGGGGHPPSRFPWTNAFGALLILLCIVLPWQIFMLANHGRTFYRAFYISEGALPAFEVVENHPGGTFFYFNMFHLFFEPWLLLAIAGLGSCFVAIFNR